MACHRSRKIQKTEGNDVDTLFIVSRRAIMLMVTWDMLHRGGLSAVLEERQYRAAIPEARTAEISFPLPV